MLNSVVNHTIFFPQKLSILQVKFLLMPISIFCISPLSLHCHLLEDSLNSIWSSYSWQSDNPWFWSYINSPHLHRFTSHTSIHLTYINSPHVYQFTSLTSIHLTYTNSPHIHQGWGDLNDGKGFGWICCERFGKQYSVPSVCLQKWEVRFPLWFVNMI